MSPQAVLRLFTGAVLPAILLGCSGSASGEFDDAEPAAEGALETSGDLQNMVVTFDSDKWKGSIAEARGSATSLGFCALEDGSDYGINDAEFLFVCRDGKYELLVDTRGHVGRLRALEAEKSAGLKCTETPFGDHQSKYECKPSGAADAKFATFDKTDFDHVRGVNWLPSVAASAQKDLVAKANARMGATRLAGVMSTNSKKCVVEATPSDDGSISVNLFQLQEDGSKTKLVSFDAPVGSVLGASASSDYVALQSQIASSSNFSGARNRKLIVNQTSSDGLKVEVISSDNGGASSKYCRKLSR